jgi:hypothetical protein
MEQLYCSQSNIRVISQREFELIVEAESLIEHEGSDFGNRLRLLRADRPDLLPISSGCKILPWLLLLQEERDIGGADACEIYWVIRSGFNLLPFEYDIPELDLDN